MDNTLNELAQDYASNDRVKIIKLNADKHQAFGQQQGVQGFPTIRLYNKGNARPYQGQRTPDAFKEAINASL